MVAEVGTTPRVWANTGITTNALRCVVVLDASSLDLVGMMANPPSNASAALIRRVYTADSNTWRAASAFENANDRNNVAKWFIAERGGQHIVQRDFAARLRANGSSVQEVDAGSLNHGQVLNNFGSANDHIMTAPMATFLRDCLA